MNDGKSWGERANGVWVSAKEFLPALAIAFLGWLIDIVGGAELVVWTTKFQLIPDAWRAAFIVATYGVAAFALFHRVRLQRDAAHRDERYSVDELHRGFGIVKKLSAEAEVLAARVFGEMDAFGEDENAPSVRREIKSWAARTREALKDAFGMPLAAAVVPTQEHFLDSSFGKPEPGRAESINLRKKYLDEQFREPRFALLRLRDGLADELGRLENTPYV